MSELAEQLASSVEALSTGGRFALRSELPSEQELNDAHAQLERVIRGQRVMRCEAVLPMPVEL